MTGVLALVAAIVLLVAAQRLRALLAFEFPACSARALAGEVAPPAGYADLYREAHDELAALGFEGPRWYLRDFDPPGMPVLKLAAAYCHRGDGAVFCLLPGVDARNPNRLNAFVANCLADGRVAISQAWDPYFACTAPPQSPARTLAPATLRMQYEAHRGWIAGFATDVDRSFTAPAAVLDFMGEWSNRRRAEMLARGDLRRDGDGVVRPRLRQALRMFVALLRRPKPPRSNAPVPAARLAAIAACAETIRARRPPARVQWTLFAASALLFAAAGALFWDAKFALLLLLVIGIHELGHFAAMRAFGYRNVHMLALPLVGGVTIGHETRPSAAGRAWMSLMGPLPGVLIGWVLLFGVLPRVGDAAADWVRDAAILFLTVNYLNLLPIPPLDGARVLQAMLPPRWHVAQAGFVAVTCALGVVGAGMLGFTALAVLALLQLTGLPLILQNGRALRLLLAEGVPPASFARSLRLRRAFDVLERSAGPARQPAARITQAETVLHAADQPAMRWWQRGVLATLMAVLLVVPIGAGLLYFAALSQWNAPQARAQFEQHLARRTAYGNLARALRMPDLVRALADGHPAAPADAGSVRNAEAALQASLPEELREFYAAANGLERIGLVAVADVGLATREEFADLAEGDVLRIETDSGAPSQVPLARVTQWLRLSAEDARSGQAIYYDIAAQPALAGRRLIRVDDGEPSAVTDLRTFLAGTWVDDQEIAETSRRMQAETARQRTLLRDASVASLLGDFDQPGLLERQLFHVPGWPSGAAQAAIAAAERRLGARLPDDLAAAYREHDGVPPLQMLRVDWLARANEWPAASQAALDIDRAYYDRDFVSQDDRGADASTLRIDPAALQRCVVVGAWASRDGAARAVRRPTLWWCPAEAAQAPRWIAMNTGRVYASFRDLLVDAVATRRAGRALSE